MRENSLGYENISKLIRKFAMPSIVGMMVTSIYNIVDQIFIGQAVGELGNAATNIAFPITTVSLAIALMFGIGGAANFNLAMGQKRMEKAPYYVGNSFMMQIICGCVLLLVVELFMEPILLACGSPDNVLPYAVDYMRIIAAGFPFVMMTIGGGHLIRADGSPGRAMLFNLSGAIINVFLDYLLTMVIQWGIAGAAYATLIGQVFSSILVLIYMSHYKTVKLGFNHLLPRAEILKKIMMLGISSFVNQIAMMLVQVVSNNLLKHYGAMSVYGSSIPIACAGIVMKINQLVFSIVIGIGQGCQPIFSYNYGAGKFDRVRETYKRAITAGILVSAVAFAIIQLFPRQIFSIFGNGSETYLEYGVTYLRIFMMFLVLSALQPITNTFFSAIEKPKKGMIIALVRQVLILLPAMLILTPIVGVNGVMYAGPIADVASGILIVIMVYREFRNMKKTERKRSKA